MHWTEVIAACIVALGSLLGVALTLATLPGIWVAIGVAMACWAWQPGLYSPWTIVAAVALGVVAEIAEVAASGAGAKKRGGTRAGIVGSIIGGIVGAIAGTVFLAFLPVVGTIVGAVAGAAAGAAAGERAISKRTWRDSARVAQGAAVGRLLSTVIKGGLAAVIGLVLTIGAFA